MLPWRPVAFMDPFPLRNIGALYPRLTAAMPDARARAFLAVFRFTGIRPGEALALERHHIVTSGRTWFLSVVQQRPDPNRWEVTPPKGRGGMARRLIPVRRPLRPHLVELLRLPELELAVRGEGTLRRVRRRVPFLFPYREHDLRSLAAELRSVSAPSFPPGRVWRVFRHTLAWELLNAGAPRQYVREVLGHESIATSDAYCRRLLGAEIAPHMMLALDG